MTVDSRRLDRRRLRTWIVALPLSAVAAVAVACGQGPAEEQAESAGSGVSVSGPWRLPSDLRTAGASAGVTYDPAPRWTGTSTCSGGLKEGARRLGASLMRRFSGIRTIGGYACRRNTASSSQMSVHGTGRALDVMIPRVREQADNGAGDPVANWLVANAARIGVQMIIWDQTVWRADGRGESRYGGPNPHTDHIHVEITNEAATLRTPFFTQGEAAEDPTDMDPNAPEPPEDEEESSSGSSGTSGMTSGSSGTSGTSTSSGSSGTSGTSGKPSGSSGTSTSSGSSGTSGTTPKPAPTPTPSSTPAPTPAPSSTSTSAPTPAPAEPTTSPSAGDLEVEDDPEPGETDSLGTGARTTTSRKGGYDDSYMPVSSCAASTARTTGPTSGGVFFTVALGALVAGVRRRRR